MPRQAIAGQAALATGIGLDDASVHRRTRATDQAGRHTATDDLFEQPAEQIALAETAVAVLGEGRAFGHVAIQPKPAEPAVGEVEVDLFAQPRLGADPVEIADQQHADHELGVDRGATGAAVMLGEAGADEREIEDGVDAAQQVIGRNVPVHAEDVEELASPICRPIIAVLLADLSRRNHD